MIKTLDLGSGREITLSNELSWLVEYKDQFGQDIVPTLMPMLLGLSQALSVLVEEAGGFDKIDEESLFRLLGSDSLVDIAIRLSGFEAVDILNITWAMAKAYDPSLKEPRAWIRSLSGDAHEEVPLVDVIVPAVAELVVKGVISSKNLTRLTESTTRLKDSLQPKKKTKK